MYVPIKCLVFKFSCFRSPAWNRISLKICSCTHLQLFWHCYYHSTWSWSWLTFALLLILSKGSGSGTLGLSGQEFMGNFGDVLFWMLLGSKLSSLCFLEGLCSKKLGALCSLDLEAWLTEFTEFWLLLNWIPGILSADLFLKTWTNTIWSIFLCNERYHSTYKWTFQCEG